LLPQIFAGDAGGSARALLQHLDVPIFDCGGDHYDRIVQMEEGQMIKPSTAP
jgi:hypothetical protein